MTTFSKYELLSKIAKGGMAEIWVAAKREPRTPREADICVIKKLLPQHAEDEEFIRMFLDEGRIVSSLGHPNIVRVFDFGTEGGTPYLAMEYLHGEDLRSAIRVLRAEGKIMSLPHALHVVARACGGLHHAHEARNEDGTPLEIVHRDVSPHNIFLTFDGGVKVVDFGIAKSLDRRWETKHGTLKGKVPYMSPEQIKARRLDRRTDIYAMGVMLYELVLGRRPYVLSAAGDFALMMAIARNDVRPPKELWPHLDPELEAIMLRAMTYDPKGRYASMLEMQQAIDAFAASRKLTVTPAGLASYLETIFGARVDAWRAAQQKDLTAHVLQVEEERAQTALHEEDEEESNCSATFVAEESSTLSSGKPKGGTAPPPSAASLLASTSSAVAAVIDVMGVTVVTLQGRIDESFEGAALGQSLTGTVLFDLRGVERITSFGVREWLEMMKAIEESEDIDVWLARCPESVATQMSLIRTFAGRSKLLSFQVQFLCDDCGTSFPRVLDCEHDAAWFRTGKGETPRCPRCNGAAKLDDDPAFLAFAIPHAGQKVPDRIRTVLEMVEQSDVDNLDIVDKTVSQDETRVRINRDVDRSVRWNRVFDGIEGRLVVDFRGVPRVSTEGAANFARAIKSLGPEVTTVEILECPLSVLFAIGARGRPGERPRITSVAFTGRCHACAAARTGIIGMGDVAEAASRNEPPFVPCRRCNAALDIAEATSGLSALFHAPPAPVSAPTLTGTTVSTHSRTVPSAGILDAAPVTPRRPPAVPQTPRAAHTPRAAPPPHPSHRHAAAPRGGSSVSRIGWVVLVASVALATLGLAGVAVVRARAPSSSAAGASASGAAVAPGPSSSATRTSADVSKELTTGAVETTPDGIEVGVAVSGTTDDASLARARGQAVLALVERLEQVLPPPVREASLNAPRTFGGAVEERFLRDVGTFASPDRIAVRIDTDQGESRLRARYRVGKTAWEKAIAFYEATRDAWGLTVARSVPTRRDGLLVVQVDSVRYPNLTRGAVLVSLDDRPALGFDALSVRGDNGKRAPSALFATDATTTAVRLK